MEKWLGQLESHEFVLPDISFSLCYYCWKLVQLEVFLSHHMNVFSCYLVIRRFGVYIPCLFRNNQDSGFRWNNIFWIVSLMIFDFLS